ncbi:hypothetical protein BGZ63DRAFT_370400 [Mariannaea sp. PMI_226]|nr:hypothetical protein BGZ63DRAFT_370400 [Mariannaea sp. PMI_226]
MTPLLVHPTTHTTHHPPLTSRQNYPHPSLSPQRPPSNSSPKTNSCPEPSCTYPIA